MAVAFAYVPSTFDGRTVQASEPQPIDIAGDPAGDPWMHLLREREAATEPEAPEAVVLAGA